MSKDIKGNSQLFQKYKTDNYKERNLKKKVKICIRVTESQREVIKKLAIKKGKNLTQYVTESCLGIPVYDSQLISQLANLTEDISDGLYYRNRIAKHYGNFEELPLEDVQGLCKKFDSFREGLIELKNTLYINSLTEIEKKDFESPKKSKRMNDKVRNAVFESEKDLTKYRGK